MLNSLSKLIWLVIFSSKYFLLFVLPKKSLIIIFAAGGDNADISTSDAAMQADGISDESSSSTVNVTVTNNLS